ncbi:MAG: DUF2163 domain-containing protein [bacterium]|nr:DUF2163 domain-containing protein [bacterium]
MLVFPQAVLDRMDEGREVIRGLIRFDLGSGTYGFSNGSGMFVHDSVSYAPTSLIKVSRLGMRMGTSADGFSVELVASPDDGLTPAILSTIHQEDYRDRPVTVLDAIFDPDTRSLLSVETMKRGYIDTIEHIVDPNEGEKLIAKCEDRGLDYTRRNGRQANREDQARRDATDTFFDHASQAGSVQVTWGK